MNYFEFESSVIILIQEYNNEPYIIFVKDKQTGNYVLPFKKRENNDMPGLTAFKGLCEKTCGTIQIFPKIINTCPYYILKNNKGKNIYCFVTKINGLFGPVDLSVYNSNRLILKNMHAPQKWLLTNDITAVPILELYKRRMHTIVNDINMKPIIVCNFSHNCVFAVEELLKTNKILKLFVDRNFTTKSQPHLNGISCNFIQ